MNLIKFIFMALLVSFFVLTVVFVNLATPTDTHAHPEYGFTPPPPPPPPGGGDDDDDGGGPGGVPDDGGTPPDYVWVQLDRCDVECSVDYEDTAVGQTFSLLAAIDNTGLFSREPMSINNNASPVEVLVHVRMVHQGSGFIVEGMLSDTGSTRVSVPYPGRWEVLMVDPPEFVNTEMMDVTGLNLAQLHADLANAPVSLGVIEANSAAPQRVKCPVVCVLDVAPATGEQPAYLPETGAPPAADNSISFIAGIFIAVSGLLIILTYRAYHLNRLQSVLARQTKDKASPQQ